MGKDKDASKEDNRPLYERFPIGSDLGLVYHRETIIELIRARDGMVALMDKADEDLDASEELEEIVLDFDSIENCSIKANHFCMLYDHPRDAVASLDAFIELLVQASLGLGSEEYRQLNIGLSKTTRTPIVVGYSPELF